MLIVLQILKRVLLPVLFAVIVSATPSILFGRYFLFFMCAFVLYYVRKIVLTDGAHIDRHVLHKEVCLVV